MGTVKLEDTERQHETNFAQYPMADVRICHGLKQVLRCLSMSSHLTAAISNGKAAESLMLSHSAEEVGCLRSVASQSSPGTAPTN